MKDKGTGNSLMEFHIILALYEMCDKSEIAKEAETIE